MLDGRLNGCTCDVETVGGVGKSRNTVPSSLAWACKNGVIDVFSATSLMVVEGERMFKQVKFAGEVVEGVEANVETAGAAACGRTRMVTLQFLGCVGRS